MQYSPPYPSPWPNISYPVDDYPLDGSIGPSRVLTRRQRAALEHAPASRPYDTPMYMSRPQTPTPDYPHEALALNMVVQPSPNYHPLTPTSTSSQYSTYGFYSASHSRSNSIANPRSASPALSTTSALTSVSSAPDAAAAANSNNGFALPPTPDSLSGAARAKQKKHRLFNVDRKQICLYHKENPNARQEDIARLYGVERSTISKILKNKTKWLNVAEDETLRIAKHRPSKFPEIEQDMVKWLLHCRDTNQVLSDSMIRNKAKEIARALGIQEDRFKASSGWIENFKHRHGVRAGVWTGEGKNVRAARALGLGPPIGEGLGEAVELRETPGDGVRLLSPLVHRDDTVDDEVDLELELDEPEEVRVQRIAATGSGDIIRPSWLRNPVNPPPPSLPPAAQPSPQQPHPSVPPTRQLPEHSPYSGAPVAPVYYDAPPSSRSELVSYDASPPENHTPMYDGAPDPITPGAQQQQYQQTHTPPHDSYPSAPVSASSSSVSLVQQFSQQTHAAPPPALAEAHAALDTVIRFFDTHEAGAGLIRADERGVLDAIRGVLFQAAGVQQGYDHTHGGGYQHQHQHQQEAR